MLRTPLILVVVVASPVGAQRASPAETPARLLQRADSAYDDGDRDLARTLYATALRGDSALSRAVFRLAQLATSPATALSLYRHYVVMEPDDPWGHMAEGDQLARMHRFREGLAAYARADSIAPGERDVSIGRARLFERAGRPGAGVAVLKPWVDAHEEDGEAWDLLGRALLRSGRPKAAGAAWTKAARLGVRGAQARLDLARAMSAPAVEPAGGGQGDSDGNSTMRLGVGADVMVADGTRIGAGAHRLTIADDVTDARGTDIAIRITARPAPDVRFEAQGGATAFDALATGGGAWSVAAGWARLRWRPSEAGPALDVRVDRAPVGYSPLLVMNQVTRSEARAAVELPLGPLRLRGSGRAGRLEARGEPDNQRVGGEAALVAPLGSVLQLSAQYRTIGFQRASAAGYFAPRRAETVEAGFQVDVEDERPFTVAADLGAGVQRVAEQGAGAGRWTRALRAWGYVSRVLGPARALFLEIEAYDAPFAPEGVVTAGNWRFLAVSGGLRWSLR